METLGTLSVIKLIEFGIQFGLAGLVLVLWYLTDRSKSQLMRSYQEDVSKILAQYGEDMEEVRRMYESNVRLVKGYEDVAKDLKDVVILNTQAMTGVRDDVRNNQYCPHVRVEKRAKGRQE